MNILFRCFRAWQPGGFLDSKLRLDAPSLYRWRAIFRRIAVAIQDLPDSKGCNLATDDENLVDECLELIHRMEVGYYYNESDLFKEQE